VFIDCLLYADYFSGRKITRFKTEFDFPFSLKALLQQVLKDKTIVRGRGSLW